MSRFERGDASAVRRLIQRLPYLTPEFHIMVVQPGLSKVKATQEMLKLLGATETYVKDTYAAEFGVIGSP